MKTRELQTLWWDWLGTSERLLRSLHEQTAAVTLRDVARVERIQPELDQMLRRAQNGWPKSWVRNPIFEAWCAP
jgi:hypothetical protein